MQGLTPITSNRTGRSARHEQSNGSMLDHDVSEVGSPVPGEAQGPSKTSQSAPTTNRGSQPSASQSLSAVRNGLNGLNDNLLLLPGALPSPELGPTSNGQRIRPGAQRVSPLTIGASSRGRQLKLKLSELSGPELQWCASPANTLGASPPYGYDATPERGVLGVAAVQLRTMARGLAEKSVAGDLWGMSFQNKQREHQVPPSCSVPEVPEDGMVGASRAGLDYANTAVLQQTAETAAVAIGHIVLRLVVLCEARGWATGNAMYLPPVATSAIVGVQAAARRGLLRDQIFAVSASISRWNDGLWDAQQQQKEDVMLRPSHPWDCDAANVKDRTLVQVGASPALRLWPQDIMNGLVRYAVQWRRPLLAADADNADTTAEQNMSLCLRAIAACATRYAMGDIDLLALAESLSHATLVPVMCAGEGSDRGTAYMAMHIITRIGNAALRGHRVETVRRLLQQLVGQDRVFRAAKDLCVTALQVGRASEPMGQDRGGRRAEGGRQTRQTRHAVEYMAMCLQLLRRTWELSLVGGGGQSNGVGLGGLDGQDGGESFFERLVLKFDFLVKPMLTVVGPSARGLGSSVALAREEALPHYAAGPSSPWDQHSRDNSSETLVMRYVRHREDCPEVARGPDREDLVVQIKLLRLLRNLFRLPGYPLVLARFESHVTFHYFAYLRLHNRPRRRHDSSTRMLSRLHLECLLVFAIAKGYHGIPGIAEKFHQLRVVQFLAGEVSTVRNGEVVLNNSGGFSCSSPTCNPHL